MTKTMNETGKISKYALGFLMIPLAANDALGVFWELIEVL